MSEKVRFRLVKEEKRKRIKKQWTITTRFIQTTLHGAEAKNEFKVENSSQKYKNKKLSTESLH